MFSKGMPFLLISSTASLKPITAMILASPSLVRTVSPILGRLNLLRIKKPAELFFLI